MLFDAMKNNDSDLIVSVFVQRYWRQSQDFYRGIDWNYSYRMRKQMPPGA